MAASRGRDAAGALLPLLLLLLLVSAASPCYIRSCYKIFGSLMLTGKRGEASASVVVEQCPSCGPGLSGTCRGPRVCCGPFGCILGKEAAKYCFAEQISPAPCSPPYSGSCRAVAGGECATRHLCCNEGGCLEDGACDVD